jgi:thiol:disulfide interchange protein DsbA
MRLQRSIIVFFLLVGLGFTSAPIADTVIVEGKDYKVLTSPQPTQNSDKIEVLEFFWYGCPHCNTLHPYIQAWLETISEDIDFHYVPAIFRATWVPAAKTFFAIKAINATEKLHDNIYDAIHLQKIDLNKEPILFDWVEKQGIDRKKFEDAYKSFAVQNQVSRSTQMSRQYKLTGVPALVVDGKYLTGGNMGGSSENTIKILNHHSKDL